MISLSKRETEVCDLVQRGLANKLIAHALGLTTGTIKEYLWKLFRKTGVSNRTELAFWNQQHKLDLAAALLVPLVA